MKTCPTCGNIYTDDLSFCLQDGTKLPGQPTLGLANRPTEVLPQLTDLNNAETIVSESNAVTPQPKIFQMSAVEPSTRMGCALSIGQVAAGLIVVVGLGLVGIFLSFRGNNDVALLEPTLSKPSNNVFTNVAGNSSANTANFAVNTGITPRPVATNGQPKTVPDRILNTNAISPPKPPYTPPTGTPRPLPAKSKPKTVGGGVLNGKAVSLPKPAYPDAARAVRAGGTVVVQVLIDESGRVISANAVSGHPLLRNAAEQAARFAMFTPTLMDGQPVKVSGVINYNFVP